MIRYNPKGLTTPQIDESRRRHGDNVITPPKDDSAWRLLLEKFRDPIIRILLLAAVLFVPGLQVMFAAADLGLYQLLTIGFAAFAPTLVIQSFKMFRESVE